jgi:NADPH:quinone reductase-like Zn-dependent oxidoreductase
VTPGYDAVGVVHAVGAGVTDFAVGDRVAAMPRHACMATHVTLKAAQLVKIDATVPADTAVAVVLTGVTAYQMLHREGLAKVASHPPPAQAAILVHGCAGGTGAMLVALARAAGVGAIYGTCSGRNVDAALAAGVTAAWDYHAGDWDERVRAATGGRGVDVVFDAVVLGGYYGKGLRALARGGRYVAYGATNKDTPGRLSMLPLIGAGVRMAAQNALWSWWDGKTALFFSVPAPGERGPAAATFAEDLVRLVGMVRDGSLAPVVGRVWPFDAARDALASIEAGAHTGKQIIHVADA